MKKFLALFICVVLLLLSCACRTNEELGGSKGEESSKEDAASGVVTILALSEMKSFLNNFKGYAQREYPNIELKFEYLSASNLSDETKYKTQVQQLRIEIMAGKGPDIFLLPTWEFGYSSEDGNKEAYFEPLFADISEAMHNRVFLPVDEYLADAKHYRPENYPAAVMEAGRTDEGQCIFPLLYTYYLLLLDKTQMADPEFSYNSIEDILNCGDQKVVDAFSAVGQQMASMYFTDIADYSEGKLLVTEDDLRYMLDFATMNLSGRETIELVHPLWDIAFCEMSTQILATYEYNEDIAYPMYMPNKDGGITAMISAFAAINANTEAPESAFKILELFYSDTVQLEISYNEYGDYLQGFNVFLSQLGPDMSVDMNTISNEGTRELVETLGSKINAARFNSNLEMVLDGYIRNSIYMSEPDDYVDYSKECYKDLKMVLAE